MKPVRLILALLVVMEMAMTAAAQTVAVYNLIPNPLPGNVASVGFEANGINEIGDGVFLSTNSGTIGQVSVVMSSWACQSGNWISGTCVSASGATFSIPITINLYSVLDIGTSPVVPAVGASIGTITQTFDIPYRPTSTPAQCGGDATVWYSSKDATCYHGVASTIQVNFSRYHIPVPSNGQLIVSVAFNTSHDGPSPIGVSAPCYATIAGCPYDSLNVGSDETAGTFNLVGTPIDPNGIFVNYTSPGPSCTGSIITGSLQLDTSPGCWVGYHPNFTVVANTNSKHHTKGNAP